MHEQVSGVIELISEAPWIGTHLATTDILGVNVACIDTLTLMDTVQMWIDHSQKSTILYVNAHCLNVAGGDPEHLRILNQADLVYPDGISVVWSSRLLSGCRMSKITGASWIDVFCRIGQEQKYRVYILAGRPGVAEKAVQSLSMKWPDLDIVGAVDGYFSKMSEADVLQDIRRTKPDVLFVGIGTPRQEKWIFNHRSAIDAPICWAVGALFDYVAGYEPRVPGWMNSLALEWLWRLALDPAGKWKRYLLGNPIYIARILRQKLSMI